MLVFLLIAVCNYLSFVESAVVCPLILQPPGAPPLLWIPNDQFGACYLALPPKTTQQRYTYDVARRECIAIGGTPASIRSRREMQFVNGLVNRSAYWIGLQRMRGNQFAWEDRTPYTFSNWRGSEPDNCCPSGQGQCTLVNYANFNGQWDDAGCNRQWKTRITVVCKTLPA